MLSLRPISFFHPRRVWEVTDYCCHARAKLHIHYSQFKAYFFSRQKFLFFLTFYNQLQGENTALLTHPSAENSIKDLPSMALPTRARPSFTQSQFLPSGNVHSPSDGRQKQELNNPTAFKRKPGSQKSNQNDHI